MLVILKCSSHLENNTENISENSNEIRIELIVDTLVCMGVTIKEVKYSDLIKHFQMYCSLSILKQREHEVLERNYDLCLI